MGERGEKEVGESKERRGGERVFVKGERRGRKKEVGAGNEYRGDWEKEK